MVKRKRRKSGREFYCVLGSKKTQKDTSNNRYNSWDCANGKAKPWPGYVCAGCKAFTCNDCAEKLLNVILHFLCCFGYTSLVTTTCPSSVFLDIQIKILFQCWDRFFLQSKRRTKIYVEAVQTCAVRLSLVLKRVLQLLSILYYYNYIRPTFSA